MSFKVVTTVDVPGVPDYGEILKQAGAEHVKKGCASEDDLIGFARDADAVICLGTIQPFTKRVLEQLAKCRFIMSLGIGYEMVDVPAATELGIMVANVPDYCLEEVSDHTMSMILAFSRQIVRLNEAVKDGKWTVAFGMTEIRSDIWPSMSRLQGQTLGLIGFGRIARTVTPKAQSFGLKVISYDPYIPPTIFQEMGVEQVELDRLLSESDFISVHTPLTDATHNLLGLEQFKKMKPTAYLINTARGAVIDEKALYTALTQGYLAGAGLDVNEPEPISFDNQLLQLKNVILTAHSAQNSATAMMEMFARPPQEVLRVLRGEWPLGLVNPEVKEKYSQKWGKI